MVFNNFSFHSGILHRVAAIAYISLGVALALLILPKIRCKSEITDSDFVKDFNNCFSFVNASTILCLNSICFKSVDGFINHFLNNLPPDEVLVISRHSIKVP